MNRHPERVPPPSKFLGLKSDLHRRRRESLRNPPMECGRRDPMDTRPEGFQVAPVVMGLEPWELLAEAKRLERAGWGPWEIRERLGLTWRGGGRP